MNYEINLIKNGNETYLLKINDKTYPAEQECQGEVDCFIVDCLPLESVKDIPMEKFPIGLKIYPREYGICNDDSVLGTDIIALENLGDTILIEFCQCAEKKFWQYDISYELFFEFKSILLFKYEELNPDFYEDNVEDDLNPNITFCYSIELPTDTIKNLIKKSTEFDYKLENDINDAVKKMKKNFRDEHRIPSETE
jgi:hypothetical protein